jgi:RNA polymerase sigma factor (sigma-70 family)
VAGEGIQVPAEWGEITRRVEGFVGRFFRGRPEVDPADVTQEVLLQLLRRLQAPAARQDPLMLALVIARRRCIDALRRVYVSSRSLGREAVGDVAAALPDGAPPADEAMERREVRTLLLKVRERLTPRCRVLLDQLLLGWRLADAARALGTTAGAARNRWFHCRRQIQEALAAWGFRREDLVG